MKKLKQWMLFGAVVGVSIVVMLSLISVRRDAWKEHVFKSDGFAITGPGGVGASIENNLHQYHIAAHDLAALVTVEEIGRDTSDLRLGLMNSLVEHHVEQKEKVLSHYQVSLQGYPGFAMEYEDGKYRESLRVYFVGTKRYTVRVQIPPQQGELFSSSDDAIAARRIQDSFRLLLQ
jgi:hypothetical protein